MKATGRDVDSSRYTRLRAASLFSEADVQLGNSSIWDLIVDAAAMVARDAGLRVSDDGGQ